MKAVIGVVLFLFVAVLLYVQYPSITGFATVDEFEPTAQTGNIIYKGGGFELYSSSITKVDATTWSVEVSGKLTRWIKLFDKNLEVEAQVWNCEDEFSHAYKSVNTVRQDGLFTLRAEFSTPTDGKLRLLLRSSGASIDTGYDLGAGELIRNWDSNLLDGIKEVTACE